MARRRGENWERAMLRWSVAEFGATRIELRHKTAEGGTPVNGFVLNSQFHADSVVIAEKVQEFLAEAQEDCDEGDNHLRSSYYVCALDDNGGILERSASIAFFKSNIDDEAELESANPKGHLSQMMRHNEALIKTVVGSLGSIISTQQQMLNSHQRREVELADRQFKVMMELEEATSLRQDRELASLRETNREKRHDSLMGETAKYLPALANRLMAPPSAAKIDATGKAMSAKLEAFMQALPEDKMPQILELLGENAGTKLGEVLELVAATNGGQA
jgi:hypothetical protein